MGTVTKTIGTAGGRDFSTITGWIASLPANLVTDGNSYVGQCYNDSEFNEHFTCAGHTTDATHFITLTAAPGQSFMDNANVRTNALVYNQANGAAIKYTSTGAIAKMSDNYTVVSRLQFMATNAFGRLISANSQGTVGVTYRDLICDSAGTDATGTTVAELDIGSFNGAGGFLINVIVYLRAAGANAIKLAGSTTGIGCAAILQSAATPTKTGYVSQYGSSLMESCAAFGFATAADAVAWSASSKNNATDKASGLPGSANQFNVAYSATAPFTQAGTSGTDLRTIAGTALSAAGFRDATNAPNDISGTPRASAPTIGPWELTATTPTGFYPSYPNVHRDRVEIVSY